MNIFGIIGGRVIGIIDETRRTCLLLIETLKWIAIGPFKKKFVKSEFIFEQMVFSGIESLVIAFFVAMFTGIVIAMQTAYQLAQLGGAVYVAGLVAVSLARELGPKRITVNTVAPGATETDIIADDTPQRRKERERIALLGRVAQPEEVAEAVSYLLSDRAGYITGETINVNGGMWMV